MNAEDNGLSLHRQQCGTKDAREWPPDRKDSWYRFCNMGREMGWTGAAEKARRPTWRVSQRTDSQWAQPPSCLENRANGSGKGSA